MALVERAQFQVAAREYEQAASSLRQALRLKREPRIERFLARVEDEGLAPIRFSDDEGRITERYPDNPNGSPRGIAGLCSPDGRHLAMMPHPERTSALWQWGWMPPAWHRDLEVSPWLQMFQNAREWCEEA